MLDPRFSDRGEDIVARLGRVCDRIGYPKSIRLDQGSEFISRDMDLWAYRHGVPLDFSRPGKPPDNVFIDAFNGWLRADCSNAHWFLSLADAVEESEAWRRDHNERRPHSAIGNKVTAALIEITGGAGVRIRQIRRHPMISEISRNPLVSAVSIV